MFLYASLGAIWLFLVYAFARAVWQWRGRSAEARQWAGTASTERMVTMVIPGSFVFWTALLVTSVGAGRVPTGPLLSVAVVVGLPGLLLAVLGTVLRHIPKWWGPQWLKELAPAERVPDKMTSAGAFELYTKRKSLPRSRRQLAELVGRRRVRWVHDFSPHGLDHGLGFYGAIAGRLAWDDRRVVFVSSDMESSVRGEPVRFTIDRGEIVAVQTVPHLCDENGKRSEAIRSPRQRTSPRVVIETSARSWVFETRRSRAILKELDPGRG